MAHHVRVRAEGEIVGRAEAIPSDEAEAGASRDPLTGLSDARAARAWLANRLDDPHRGPIVGLLLGVSRFDAINAAFGRASGDAVLQAMARRIERQAEADGHGRIAARLAGAEFAVLLDAPATLGDGRFLAGELVEAVSRSDYPVIQYTILMFAIFFVLINLATDLLTQWLDPRTREEARGT